MFLTRPPSSQSASPGDTSGGTRLCIPDTTPLYAYVFLTRLLFFDWVYYKMGLLQSRDLFYFISFHFIEWASPLTKGKADKAARKVLGG